MADNFAKFNFFTLPVPIKEAWLNGLVSGEYMQGLGKLYHNPEDPFVADADTYCCIGVLCDVILKNDPALAEEWGILRDKIGGIKIHSSLLKQDFDSLVPAEVLADSQNASLQDQLIERNDTGRTSFKEIAEFLMTQI